MSDTSERVGAVDGDALIEFLTTVTAMSHEAWQEIYDEITSGRFALKPEASQETKWQLLAEEMEARFLNVLMDLICPECKGIGAIQQHAPDCSDTYHGLNCPEIEICIDCSGNGFRDHKNHRNELEDAE